MYSKTIDIWALRSLTSLLLVTVSLPRVINFNFLFHSLTSDTSYSVENLAIDSLLRRNLIDQSFLIT